MQIQNFRIKLVSQEDLNSIVKYFRFEVLDDFKLSYLPGQFVSLNLNAEGGKLIRRSYSIANLDDAPSVLELAVTMVQSGVGTQSLCALKPGDVVTASGPRGKFTFRDTIFARHILIGTGTGIVPYRSMLGQIEAFLQNASNSSCIVLEGIRNRRDIIFKEDFMKLCHYKNFNFKIYLSREDTCIGTDSHEALGHVQDSFSIIKPNPETDIIYLCGNPYMIEEVTAILDNLSFPYERIVKEQYFAKAK
jgi:ferredoxin-NADP reductase